MPISHLFRRSCKDSSAYNNRANGLSHGGSNLTTTIASIAAGGLILSSAGFGAVFAWTSGAEHGPLLASLMVVMAVALELAKPLAVSSAFSAFRSWAIFRGVALALLALVAIVYSLSAELSLVAGSRGDLVAKREAAIESHDDKRESVRAARAELVALAPSRTVAEVQADITSLLAAYRKADGCRNEIMANATQRLVCPKVAALNGEIARAERRAELEAKISKATDRPTAAPIVKNSDPGSTALATYLATLGVTVAAGKLADWMVLVPVMALELGAALSVLLVQSVPSPAAGSVQAGHVTASQTQQTADVTRHQPATQPRAAPVNDLDSKKAVTKPRTVSKPSVQKRASKRRLGQASGVRKADAQTAILDTLKGRGGKLDDASVRGIAQLIGGRKSTVHSALAGLVAAGVVTRMGSELVLQAT